MELKARAYYGPVTGLTSLNLEKPVPDILGNLTNSMRDLIEPEDLQLLQLVYMPIDHENLLNRLYQNEKSHNTLGNFSSVQVAETAAGKLWIFPYPEEKYFDIELPRHESERNLYTAYVKYCRSKSSKLLNNWIDLNLALSGTATLHYAEILKQDLSHHLIIDEESELSYSKQISELIENTGMAKDVDMIMQQSNLEEREWMTDQLLWKWLEEQLFLATFKIERLMVHGWQQQMISRWAKLRQENNNELEDILGDIMKSL